MIGDDELSRSGTPRPMAEGEAAPEKLENEGAADSSSIGHDGSPQIESPNKELPTDVRVKLRRLEKLESRYHELLRSYRIAHAKVQTIEPFEATLRENTPLMSISDPSALAEYLNQVKLKGDMILDELKRISTDRDDCKKKLTEAEKTSKEAWNEVANLRKNDDSESTNEELNGPRREDDKHDQDLADGDHFSGINSIQGMVAKSPPASIRSPTSSLRGLSIFSPKLKSVDSPKLRQGSEDLFSYDGEIPRLEAEAKEKQDKIVALALEVETLKGDLAVTRESTQSMVQTLEESTREVNALRESKDRSETEARQQQHMLERTLEDLRSELRASERNLKIAEAKRSSRNEQLEDLESQFIDTKTELVHLQQTSETSLGEHERLEEHQMLVAELQAKVMEASARNLELELKLAKALELCQESQSRIKALESRPMDTEFIEAKLQRNDVPTSQKDFQSIASESAKIPDAPSTTKKKGKKKKKSGKPLSEENDTAPDSRVQTMLATTQSSDRVNVDTFEKLREELRQLQTLIDEKDAAIAQLTSKLKDQEGLQEEIETLRDDLLHVGQEHVESKDRVKDLQVDKAALEQRLAAQEESALELQASSNFNADSDQKHKDLLEQFEALKSKAAALQTDLSAAQQLASSRFKDLNDLRSVLQKAQPEIEKARNEAAEMKGVKEALGKKEAEFKRLDSRHEDMRSELTGLKQTIAIKESEIISLNKKINQETSSKLKAEEGSSKAIQELQRLEVEKRQATESLDRLSKELAKSKEDLLDTKARLRDIEQQLSKHRSESAGLQEDVELKAAQYASAQSLMASMRDQTAEMAIQLKEARERCESLDEEVADAHRLLSERSREGETMRRLLADVEGRADARVREMKERMDVAVEERDRAEDEASMAGRKKAREFEDVRNKYRDVERNLKRVEDEKEELELAQKDWKRRREELESRAEGSRGEAEEVRKAMGELRDALDESERQARESERQKSELRRSVEETQIRLEKLQKSNKVYLLPNAADLHNLG